MENKIRVEATDDLIEVFVSGRLTHEMYADLAPVVEQHVRTHGKLRMLFVMHDFHGWTAGALWDDLKFDLKHFRDIQRLAIVGEKRWQKGMSVFCKPFTTAKIKFFSLERLEQAREWVKVAAAKA